MWKLPASPRLKPTEARYVPDPRNGFRAPGWDISPKLEI